MRSSEPAFSASFTAWMRRVFAVSNCRIPRSDRSVQGCEKVAAPYARLGGRFSRQDFSQPALSDQNISPQIRVALGPQKEN